MLQKGWSKIIYSWLFLLIRSCLATNIRYFFVNIVDPKNILINTSLFNNWNEYTRLIVSSFSSLNILMTMKQISCTVIRDSRLIFEIDDYCIYRLKSWFRALMFILFLNSIN